MCWFPSPESSTNWSYELCSTSHKSICVNSRLMARRFCPCRLHATLLWHEASWALREDGGGHLSVVVCQQIAVDWWSLALVNKIHFEIIADPYSDQALPLSRVCPSPYTSKHLYVWRHEEQWIFSTTIGKWNHSNWGKNLQETHFTSW